MLIRGYNIDVKTKNIKLVTKILMKTCSSLVKIISHGVNNFMQNKCNRWMKYRPDRPDHLYGVDLIDMQFQD